MSKSIRNGRFIRKKKEPAVHLRMVRYLYETFVVPEYRERMREFFDLHTLAERLEKDETVAAEYLAVDGNWHTARFIAKRWNNEGKVTHALYVARLISDEKRREKNWIAIAGEATKQMLRRQNLSRRSRMTFGHR